MIALLLCIVLAASDMIVTSASETEATEIASAENASMEENADADVKKTETEAFGQEIKKNETESGQEAGKTEENTGETADTGNRNDKNENSSIVTESTETEETEAKDTETKKPEITDTEAEDTEIKNTETGDTEIKNTESADTETKEPGMKDDKAEDTERKDTEIKEPATDDPENAGTEMLEEAETTEETEATEEEEAAAEYNITVMHLYRNGTTYEELYRQQSYQVTEDQIFSLDVGSEAHQKAFEITKVIRLSGNGQSVDEKTVMESTDERSALAEGVMVTGDTIYAVIYAEKQGSWTSRAVTMFDYDLGTVGRNGQYQQGSVNYAGNYDSTDSRGRMSMGNASVTNSNAGYYDANGNWQSFKSVSAGMEYGTEVFLNRNNTNLTPYQNNGSAQAYTRPIVTGIIQGLSGEHYEKVDFQYSEPGFFSADAKSGKTVYANRFELNFAQSGYTYTLDHIRDYVADVSQTANTTNGFFPLNHLKREGSGNNEYFGMRFDFTFRLGDYTGPLEYQFSGDDDLWVFLDGRLVLDLGGEHSAYPYNDYGYFTQNGDWIYANYKNPGSSGERQKITDVWPDKVDLWEALRAVGEEADTEKMHTITILYMERGGADSNCNMKFVIPDPQAIQPVITDVERTYRLRIAKKIDRADFSQGDPIFTFAITNKETGATYYRSVRFTESSQTGYEKEGLLTDEIDSLPEGTYVVKELPAIRYETDIKQQNNAQLREITLNKLTTDESGLFTVWYFNRKKKADDFSDTDMVINRYHYDADRQSWFMEKDRLAGQENSFDPEKIQTNRL